LSGTYKILSTILCKLTPCAEEIIEDLDVTGPTTAHTFYIRQVLEKKLE